MASLSETYGARGASVPPRLYAGVGLFAAGVLLVLTAILAAGTTLLTSRGYTLGEARLAAGVLGGIGVPLAMLGVMAVLPAGRTTRAAAVVGAFVSLLGVALFAHAYPCQWIGGTATCPPGLTDLTLPTAIVYAGGAATTLWCVLAGVANLKTRNDPGGTVTMEVTHQGETRIIEVDRSRLDGAGGVGLLGGTPDGEVATQTNRDGPAGGPAAGVSGDGGRGDGGLSSPLDGGRAAEPGGGRDPGSPGDPGSLGGPGSPASDAPDIDVDAGPAGADGWETGGAGAAHPAVSGATGAGPSPAGPNAGADRDRGAAADRYCGSCGEFRYVRTEDGMRPYCGLHDELMDDMDACEEWTPR